MLLSFLLNMGLLNLIGGRGPLDLTGEKWIWRWILPALAAGAMAHSLQFDWASILWIAFATSAWYPGNHSFEAIHGIPDPSKYDGWVEWIGYKLIPYNGTFGRNRARGALMMGLDAYNEYPTFVLLLAINPWASLIGFGLLFKGVIYWIAGRIVTERFAVALAEFLYWVFKGALIFLAVKGAAYGGW